VRRARPAYASTCRQVVLAQLAVLRGRDRLQHGLPDPARAPRQSFKEFVEEWILDQFEQQLASAGPARPWYWDQFLRSIDHYHHMVYASAYTYRATVWFDLVVPGPDERRWLREKYPTAGGSSSPIWEQSRPAGAPAARRRVVLPRRHPGDASAISASSSCAAARRSRTARRRWCTRAEVHLLLRAVSLDLRARARALRGRTATWSSGSSPARRRRT
jgi:hypothetical protein